MTKYSERPKWLTKLMRDIFCKNGLHKKVSLVWEKAPRELIGALTKQGFKKPR